MIKRLSKADFIRSKVTGVDVAFVWAKDLQELIEERDELKSDNTLLRMKIHKIEQELTQVKGTMNTALFVDLRA
jgi:uncharacterized coiled-coil DUF342 family protein